jgi:hypothetical protein
VGTAQASLPRLEAFLQLVGTAVGCEDEQRVAEVDGATLPVGETPIVEHLQKDVEDILSLKRQNSRAACSPSVEPHLDDFCIVVEVRLFAQKRAQRMYILCHFLGGDCDGVDDAKSEWSEDFNCSLSTEAIVLRIRSDSACSASSCLRLVFDKGK